MARKIAAGNWKMNGGSAALSELTALAEATAGATAEIIICPPATLLSRASDATKDTPIAIGGQDCHTASAGAHTGDISTEMLTDAGAMSVILGHSERRTDHGETDALVCAKAETALSANLTAIVCIGETLEEREAGQTLAVAGRQLAASVPASATGATCVVAYEPVWAIGTGKVPTLEQIAEVHDFLRAELTTRFGAEIAEGISLLYGGSVKSSNAADIFAVSNVDGALVGGASLKAADFAPIVTALSNS